MDIKSTQFLKQVFKQFYFQHTDQIEAPNRISEREFGYVPFNGTMIRHLAFQNVGELMATLVKEAPSAAYYSCSYYQDPTLPMEEKGWKGGDLIFDVDADDLALPCKQTHDQWTCRECKHTETGVRPERCPKCGATRMEELNWVCHECLGGAKQETVRLIDILMKDFGVSTDEIRVYFSGNMGYHTVVQKPAFEGLDQAGRSDIADYVSGLEIPLDLLGVFPRATYDDLILRLPLPSEPGWRGRFAGYFQETLETEDSKDVRQKVASLFGKLRYGRFKKLIEDTGPKIGSAIDASVTTDIHRIFRLPGTLHGETGLLKKKCDDLQGFDPLVDPVVLGEEPVAIFVTDSPRFVLRGQTFGPYRQENVKLPLMAAIYLLGRELARVQ